MPPGVPVATVAINGAANAALLALQIISLQNQTLMDKMIAYKQSLMNAVEDKAEKLEKYGWKKYLSGKKS
jgi:phosphoribosylcarboxyaminoimidazole (NCAIR) mutase